MSMFRPLSAILRPATTVPLDLPLRVALVEMERTGAGAVVVTDPARRIPLGIFTLRDLVRRVTLPGGDLDQPIAAVMTSGLITLPPQTTAHHAALMMARNAVGHVVVVEEDGRLAGVVTRDDLFGLERGALDRIADGLQGARDVEGLHDAAEAIRAFTRGLLAQGVGAEAIGHQVSTLNDLLTVRVLDLTLDEHDVPPVPLCWIALGSEGRLEQTFSTDQDNGLIFEAEEADADEVRRALLPFARAVNERLDRCGFPLCKGGVMASNPPWCQPLATWKRTFLDWIETPSPEALLDATIFFDLRPVYGSAALAERLRATLLAAAADRPVFLRHMAANALRCRPPLGVVRDFVYDRSTEFPHTIDLKASGSRLFVDAARIFALAHGVPHTSTAERLRALDPLVHFGAEAIAALVDAFHFVHRLRLRTQVEPGPRGGTNRVDPSELNDLDRHVLKEALRQAKRLQAALARRYELGS